MRAYINLKKKKTVAMLLALMPFILLAQDVATTVAAPAAKTGGNETDMIWYIIIGTMAVLLFAIMILGNVLVNLVRVVLEKSKAKSATLILLMLLSVGLFAETPATSLPAGGSTLAANWNMIMAGCVLLAELFVIIVLLLRIRLILIELSDKKEKAPVFQIHLPKLFDNINASVAVEKEHDILLDHNYDGIRELDNNLPPWWKYSFYLSIVFAISYLTYYHVLGGPSSHDEYETSVRLAQAQLEEYVRQHPKIIDENSVVMADAAGISEGKDIFTSHPCVGCHGASAEGKIGLGPNLTDDYWLHGGSIGEVFKSIKFGYNNKGMPSWKDQLSPAEIQNVASYIKSLHGTNPPNAKAPEGDLYKPVDDKAAKTPADSTAKKSI